MNFNSSSDTTGQEGVANISSRTVAGTETPMVPGGAQTDTDDRDRRSDSETLGHEVSRLTLNQLSPRAQYLSCRCFPVQI